MVQEAQKVQKARVGPNIFEVEEFRAYGIGNEEYLTQTVRMVALMVDHDRRKIADSPVRMVQWMVRYSFHSKGSNKYVQMYLITVFLASVY